MNTPRPPCEKGSNTRAIAGIGWRVYFALGAFTDFGQTRPSFTGPESLHYVQLASLWGRDVAWVRAPDGAAPSRRPRAADGGACRPPATIVELYEPLRMRVLDQFGDVVEVELAHDVGAVALDRLLADRRAFGDLLVGVALGDQRQDLAFASRERFTASAGSSRPANAALVVLDELGGDRRVQERRARVAPRGWRARDRRRRLA